MKKILIISFLFLSITSFSQIVISGTVQDKNGPLEGAAIYLNNSMLGTTSNRIGRFELPVKEGVYELVVSYLGYKKIIYQINTSNPLKPFRFILEEEENKLKEIVIKKTVYDRNWERNLRLFKREFLGRTSLSESCKINNEDVLSFYYDSIENKLEAFAKKPLKIIHYDLGYEITYDLETFVRTNNHTLFLGFSKYKELKGNNRKQKKWAKNRVNAYLGSTTHFYKSLIKNKLKEEGFIVNQFKRLKNNERPSEEEISKARKLINQNRNIIVDLTKNKESYSVLDSAWITVRKAKLPKFKDFLYKSELLEEEIINKISGNYYFNFDDNLMVVYTKEKEEVGYIALQTFKRREPNSQTSSIIQINKNTRIDSSGILFNPLDVLYEGYWSFEKFAHQLPIDYNPITENQD